jgi:type I restriction enzyme R subunit
MSLDKPLKMHNLVQAIARVNRVYPDKEGGLVVDYLGVAETLDRYKDENGKSILVFTSINTNKYRYK